MSGEVDIGALQAEVVALQAVVIALSRQLARDHPQFGPTICRAFEEAEALMSGIAMQFGMGAPMDVTVGALRVIDEIRTAVIRDESICGPGADPA